MVVSKFHVFIALLVLCVVGAFVFIIDMLSENKFERVTILEPRGGIVPDLPVQEQCELSRMNYLERSHEFVDNGYATCKLVNAKVATHLSQCSIHAGAAGCSICVLKCK